MLVEQTEHAPPRSDVVLVRLREHNKGLTTGMSNEDIGYGLLYLSDVRAGQWQRPCWLNFYGQPRALDDPFLQRPSAKSKDDAEQLRKLGARMDSAKVAGTAYRGRLLLSAWMNLVSPSDDGWGKSSSSPGDGGSSEGRQFSPLDTIPIPRQQLRGSRVPWTKVTRRPMLIPQVNAAA
eukprot:COSAG05_NODE_2868_length_2555_cov_2.015879_1_plen_177_part_10